MMFLHKVKMCDIAMFVGAALNHPNPPCNGEDFISTINVDQYKTKFSDIRIYCTLAHPTLVKKEWESAGKDGSPTPDFFEKCLWRDAVHYRRCYMAMLDILGDDEDMAASLKAPANYSELLCKSPEELDGLLNYNIEKAKLYPQYLQHFYSKWNVSDPDALRKLLFSLSGFRIDE